MHDKVGVVAEIPECFCQKAEIAVPEELIGADGEVGVEKDFQGISDEERQPTFPSPQKLSGQSIERLSLSSEFAIRDWLLRTLRSGVLLAKRRHVEDRSLLYPFHPC